MLLGGCILRPLALVLICLAASEARLLVVSQTSLGNGAGSLYTIQEMSSESSGAEATTASETASSGPESLPGVLFGPIFSSPFAWLQQQLMIMEALQQAALQGLRPVMEAEPQEEPAPSANEMLRHVGCARMRAAMLDQMARERAWAEAEQGSGTGAAGAVSARSAAASAATRHAAAGDGDEAVAYDDEDGYDDDDEYYYEYYEDYGTSRKQQGMIAGMVAAGMGHMLRGAFADAAMADAQAVKLQQLQIRQAAALQQQAMSREELEDRIASKAAMRIAAALDAAGGVARLSYDDSGEDAELVMSGTGNKAVARSARDFLTSLYEYADEDDEDEDEVDDEEDEDEVMGMAETMLSNLEALLSDDDDDEAEEAEEPYARSKGEFQRQQQKKQSAARAASAGSSSTASSAASRGSELDDSDEAWEDYLEQYYAYYSIYGDGGDEEDIYDSYYESYLDPYAEAPDALDMLASLAELIAWSSHTGSLVLHLLPIGGLISGGGGGRSSVTQQLLTQEPVSPAQLQLMQLQHLREQSDAAEVAEARAGLLFPGQPYDPAAMADPFALFMGRQQEDAAAASAGTIVISDLNLAWLNPDGSLNWGLVTLLILTAGTLAMLVGFVVSWVSLRRTMRTAAVYPGGAAAAAAAACRRAGARRAAAKACGASSDGSECDSLDNPLLLLPEDCYGAEPLKIECASTYVPPVLPNESVAKVLCK